MNGLMDLYFIVTFQWMVLETINLINKFWLKKIKEQRIKGSVLEILPNTGHHNSKSIYSEIIVETKQMGNVKARCLGWYPQIGEEILLERKSYNNIDYSCLSLNRYLKERVLNIFLIPIRILLIIMWSGLLLWLINPTLIRNFIRIIG